MNLTTLTELQNDFNSALEKTINKNFLIENELREINNYLDYSPTPKIKRTGLVHLKKANQTQIFKLSISNMLRPLFTEAVHSILTTGKFQTIKSIIDTEESLNIKKQISKQAVEFSEYYRWLKELDVKKVSLERHIPLNQVLLALYYMGLNVERNKSKTANVLSEILNKDKSNIRKSLSYVQAGNNNVRTESNLIEVLHLFERNGYDEIVREVREDIDRLNRKKPM